MRVQNRAGAEKADARDDLRGDARRVAIGTPVGREPDLRDVDRQMGKERGADADENIGTEAGRLPGDLTLEANRATEERGEKQLQEQREAQGVAQRGERRRMGGRLLQQDERGNGQRSARIEIADISRCRVG